MNESAVLCAVKNYLNSKKEISEEEFSQIFDVLELKEKYKVIELFIKNDIFLVDEKDPDCSPLVQPQSEKKVTSNPIPVRTVYNSTSNEQLCLLIQNGDKVAKRSLLIKCKDFIAKQALINSNRYNHKLTLDDLIQVGNIGALKAAEKFDTQKGFTYLTYAKYWIDQSITRHIIDEGFTIRLPVHMFDAVSKITKYQSKYKDLDQEVLVKKICDELNITKEKYNYINRIKKNIMNPKYLDELINNTDGSEIIESIIKDKEDLYCSKVEKNAIDNNLKANIKKMLLELKPKEQAVIISRFDLDESGSKTLEEIGQKHGVTRERIRQIEARALSKLRKTNKARKLELDIDITESNTKHNIKEIIYSFKDKKGNSRIPERSELIKKILTLYQDIDDENELTEKFITCAIQNGYRGFNSKEKNAIKQSFSKLISNKLNMKNPIRETIELIIDLEPTLLNKENEFYSVFKDFAPDFGYSKPEIPNFNEFKIELDKYKE